MPKKRCPRDSILPELPPELRPHATLATQFPPALRIMVNLPWRGPSHQQQHHRANPTASDDLRAWTIGTLPAHAARLLVGQWITTGMDEDQASELLAMIEQRQLREARRA